MALYSPAISTVTFFTLRTWQWLKWQRGKLTFHPLFCLVMPFLSFSRGWAFLLYFDLGNEFCLCSSSYISVRIMYWPDCLRVPHGFLLTCIWYASRQLICDGIGIIICVCSSVCSLYSHYSTSISCLFEDQPGNHLAERLQERIDTWQSYSVLFLQNQLLFV